MTRMDIVEHRHRAGAMRILIASLMLSSFCVISVPPVAADDWPAGPPDPIKLMEMVLVKGGCYQMGDTFGDGAENERPVHEACVKDFYIGKYPVTQMQWVGAMGTNLWNDLSGRERVVERGPGVHSQAQPTHPKNVQASDGSGMGVRGPERRE